MVSSFFCARFRKLLLHVLGLALSSIGMFLASSSPASAQSCTYYSFQSLDFGTISDTANTDAQTIVSFGCQPNGQTTFFRVCIYIAPTTIPTTSINPRRMTNNAGNNPAPSFMDFNVYSNPSRSPSTIIGPDGDPGYTVHSITFSAPPYIGTNRTIPIYGRVPPQPTLPNTDNKNYENNLTGSFRWAASNTAFPADCNGGTPTSISGYFQARVSPTCRITLATDHDFGRVPTTTAAIPQTSTIIVRCARDAPWTLGLNNGNNGVRRMKNTSGNEIQYELYKDSGYAQRWGNAAPSWVAGSNNGLNRTLIVYGRVPAQPSVPGDYIDRVIATLTF